MMPKHFTDQSPHIAYNSNFDAFLDLNQNMPINSNSSTDQKDLTRIDQTIYRSRINIQKTFKQVANMLQHHEIHNIYHIIVDSKKIAISQFQQKSQIWQIPNFYGQYSKNLRRRCLTIKQNNMTLLQLILNLKQTFTRVLRPVMSTDDQKYQELYIVKDKIQQASANVSKKLHQLIASRLFSRTYTKKHEKKIHKFEPINIPLSQLKAATEIIDNQLIKQRQQIHLLVKQLFNQNM